MMILRYYSVVFTYLVTHAVLVFADSALGLEQASSLRTSVNIPQQVASNLHLTSPADSMHAQLSTNAIDSSDKASLEVSARLRGKDSAIVSMLETDPTTAPTRRPTAVPTPVPTLHPTSSAYFNGTGIERVDTSYGTGILGYASNGVDATNAAMSEIRFMAFDASANIYLADSKNNAIRLINGTTNIIETITGTTVAGINGDGNAITTMLNFPTGLAFSPDGDLYFADSGNKLLRKVSTVASTATTPTTGVVTTIANLTGIYYDPPTKNSATVYQDSPNATYNLAFGQDDTLYISDRENCLVYNISLSFANAASYSNLAYVSVFAGVISNSNLKPVCGNSGSGNYLLRSTQFNQPMGLAVDNTGILYVADSGNNRILRLSGGISSVFVGTGTQGYTGDGGPGMISFVQSFFGH
jgi:hypothetical protein